MYQSSWIHHEHDNLKLWDPILTRIRPRRVVQNSDLDVDPEVVSWEEMYWNGGNNNISNNEQQLNSEELNKERARRIMSDQFSAGWSSFLESLELMTDTSSQRQTTASRPDPIQAKPTLWTTTSHLELDNSSDDDSDSGKSSAGDAMDCNVSESTPSSSTQTSRTTPSPHAPWMDILRQALPEQSQAQWAHWYNRDGQCEPWSSPEQKGPNDWNDIWVPYVDDVLNDTSVEFHTAAFAKNAGDVFSMHDMSGNTFLLSRLEQHMSKASNRRKVEQKFVMLLETAKANGVDAAIDSKNAQGETLLVLTAKSGFPRLTLALLNAGADYRTENRHGIPLLSAVQREVRRSRAQNSTEGVLKEADIMVAMVLIVNQAAGRPSASSLRFRE